MKAQTTIRTDSVRPIARADRRAAAAHANRQLYLACKRLGDVLIAGTLVFMFLPLMALLALLIVLDTPGPAIFRQERVGARRRRNSPQASWEACRFTFYKFRTMYNDADPAKHCAFVRAFIAGDEAGMAAAQGEETRTRKLVHDRRVTRMGRFLRKSSLDELPQLINVLKGDMSMVGPRPPIPYEVEMYQPWHHRRFAAQPGLTGLWQVTARSSADFDEMVRLDLEYIQRQSLLLDLKILLQTPLAVLSGKGAA